MRGIGIGPLLPEEIERLRPFRILQRHRALGTRQRKQHELQGNKGFLRPLERLRFGGALIRITGRAFSNTRVESKRSTAQWSARALIKRMDRVDGQDDFPVLLVDVIKRPISSCL